MFSVAALQLALDGRSIVEQLFAGASPQVQTRPACYTLTRASFVIIKPVINTSKQEEGRQIQCKVRCTACMTRPCQADRPGGRSQHGRGVKREARLRVPHAPAPPRAVHHGLYDNGPAANQSRQSSQSEQTPGPDEEYMLDPVIIILCHANEEGCPHQPPLAPRRSSQYCRRPCMQRTGYGT